MNIEQKIAILVELGDYLRKNTEEWQQAKATAAIKNPWFTETFVQNAAEGIASWLHKEQLMSWAAPYNFEQIIVPKTIGLVMAGNIPLVGFHDWLCIFMSGHKAIVKLSSKDDILFPHIFKWLVDKAPVLAGQTVFEEILRGADAYIATGSNNSSRYFDYYFGKYPHIIRKNRTSAAILTGSETAAELELLADDIHLYFGMGCRNVTQLLVPENYDFVPLLESFKKYSYFFDHPKFRNNYDYHLAVRILNKEFYMTKESVLLVESTALFAPISVLNYTYITATPEALRALIHQEELQCLVGAGYTPFGMAQHPLLTDYADGVNTLAFLKDL